MTLGLGLPMPLASNLIHPHESADSSHACKPGGARNAKALACGSGSEQQVSIRCFPAQWVVCSSLFPWRWGSTLHDRHAKETRTKHAHDTALTCTTSFFDGSGRLACSPPLSPPSPPKSVQVYMPQSYVKESYKALNVLLIGTQSHKDAYGGLKGGGFSCVSRPSCITWPYHSAWLSVTNSHTKP